ncbi:PKD domain-containing protein [Salibacteraceae bacterium]|nr:PKD domain-containing protein [Salibacteraceae bacterium]
MRLLITLITLSLLAHIAPAQYCTPVGNCVFDDNIDDFQFNTISNLNSGGSNCGSRFAPRNAYSNTGIRTTVTQGQKYYMRVASNAIANREQGFGIWIDFNNDNDFEDLGEFVWNSAGADSAFTDSILIPFSSSTGLTRMRVRSQRNATINSTQSCSTINRGETEDYLIDIQAARIAPLTDFTSNTTFTCDGIVKFEDTTPNQVTSRLWDFGDGGTSTLSNPTHNYTSTGVYTVKLTCTNSFGSKQEVKTNLITYNASGLKRASCSPNTSSVNAGFGISNFSFTTINNPSADATVGFEDLSCIQGTAKQGVVYQMTISAPNAPANQNFRAWIDYNNDGLFSNSTELVLSQDDQKSGIVSLRIPSNIVIGTPLRIRVAAVYTLSAPASASFNACSNLSYGQMEDYSIVFSLNTSAPAAEFEAGNIKSCNGTVEFSDLSTNVPTTWAWDFGDGNTSILQNPRHTYAASGDYTVSLTASNLYGSNKTTKTSYISVKLADAVKSACIPTTNAHREDYGIRSVLFESINNSTEDGRVGYEDFSCDKQVIVEEAKTYNIEIKTGSLNLEDVYVWIDYNNDGLLDPTNEQAFFSSSDSIHKGTITIPSASIKFKPLRMRVMSDILGTNPNACTNPNYGQAEDYGLIITGDNTGQPQAPNANFSADSIQSCLGLIKFTDNSSNSPTNWNWDFGDGNTSTLQNPSHQYSSAGVFTIKLTASNSIGNDVETKMSYLEVDERFCAPGAKDGEVGIEAFTFEKSILVYPNPAQDIVNIEFPVYAVQKFEVALISVQGQVLYLNEIEVGQTEKIQLSLEGFSTGLQFIQIKMGESTFTKKLIVK